MNGYERRCRVLLRAYPIRWREHPPLGRWLLYRLAGKRLPSKWRMWTRDDIRGWGLLAYQTVLFLLSGALTELSFALFAEPGWNDPRLAVLSWIVLVGIILAVYAGRKGMRRQSFCRQGFRPDGKEWG